MKFHIGSRPHAKRGFVKNVAARSSGRGRCCKGGFVSVDRPVLLDVMFSTQNARFRQLLPLASDLFK